MSPIEIGVQSEEEIQEATDQEIEALLMDEHGKPTMEAEVISDFLHFVEWDAMFEDDELIDVIHERDAFILSIKDGEDFEEVEEGTEGAEKITVLEIDGEDLVQIVDEDDLLSMFGYYVSQLPEDTLEEKARKAVFGALGVDERGMMFGKKYKKGKSGHKDKKGMMAYEDVDEDELEEGPFRKGQFRKIHKAGGKDQVARMLIAMMKKEVIVRAPGGAGTGYKKGDYKKSGAGYPSGTAKGKKKHKAYVKKSKAKIAKAAKKAKKGKRIAARFTAKAKTKKGEAKKKGKKKLAASAPAPTGTRLLEGAGMAAAVVNYQTQAENTARTNPLGTKDSEKKDSE